MGIPIALATLLAALFLTGCGGGGTGPDSAVKTVGESVRVPELSGLRPDDATARICAAGLAPAAPEVITGRETGLTVAQINRRLRVVASRPAAGARVAPGTPVSITLRSPASASLAIAIPSCAVASAPAPWTIDLADVAFGPAGIGVALHPTRAPIAISVDSDLPLRVCPADPLGRPADPALSSFGRRWTECRPLGAGDVELPQTDGRSHVGFRILTADGGPGTLRRLRVRWTCQDAYFVFRDPGGRTPAPVPRCHASVPAKSP